MKTRRVLSIVFLAFILVSFSLGLISSTGKAQSESTKVVTITFNGPLSPVWKEILQRGITLAEQNHAKFIIIRLNTTGGAIDLMNNLIQMILDSETPVVVYVAPQGSMAASAGTLLTLSGQVAAMAPDTIIGAASPVGSQGENIETTEETKTKEALKATARSLAAWRGVDAVNLVEAAIENAKAASAEEALNAGLVDMIARDDQDLLSQLNGRTIDFKGGDFTFDTTKIELIETPITAVETVLALLTNPNIVFLLLAIAIQAILIEISSPGGWVAGFIGAVLLVVAIYGLGLLPVNYVGIVFIVIAFILFVLDIKAPTHGALTAAGTGSFIAGGLILFNSASVPGFANVSVGLVVGMGLFLGVSFFLVVMLAVRAMKVPVATGQESMTLKEGYALTDIDGKGIAQIGGEQWSAILDTTSAPVKEGDRVIVVKIDGLKMIVRKK